MKLWDRLLKGCMMPTLKLISLERLFNKYLGLSPARYYLNLRLKRARQLLSHTSMPILQVAVACGFTSASHFARCYRQLFGHAPRQERPVGIAPH